MKGLTEKEVRRRNRQYHYAPSEEAERALDVLRPILISARVVNEAHCAPDTIYPNCRMVFKHNGHLEVEIDDVGGMLKLAQLVALGLSADAQQRYDESVDEPIYTMEVHERGVIVKGEVSLSHMKELVSYWEMLGFYFADTRISKALGVCMVITNTEHANAWRDELGIEDKAPEDNEEGGKEG